MGKKMMLWKTKGMNQDLSMSAFNPEFSFENMNLRLSTNEGNTLMSWVNEKGTESVKTIVSDTEVQLFLDGVAIGSAVLNNKLIVFTTSNYSENKNTWNTTNDEEAVDHIYKLEWADKDELKMNCDILFLGNLNFSALHPLETLVSYESEDIQKVYWVDGRNQPRVINIAASAEKMASWVDTSFDFVPEINYGSGGTVFTASVAQGQNSSGLFAPGVIQYCITYLNKFGQESNIVWVSPLYYISHANRGASPEDKVSTSFTLTITNADTNYDYVRIYSIQRTSKDLEPFVKLLDAIPTGASITYTDNGTTGASIDPTVLLFIGGKEIVAGTIADKDGTLFLGDIKQEWSDVSGLQSDIKTANIDVSFAANKELTFDHTYGIYAHTNTMKYNSRQITTFKGGETYRFGFQLQKKNGEWTEPVFLNDKKNEVYPNAIDNGGISDTVSLVSASASIPVTGTHYDMTQYQKIRPLIVYPTIADREVLCQGVLNPTVFNVMDRIGNAPFAQASWYFRPSYGADSHNKPGKPRVVPLSDLNAVVTNPSPAFDPNTFKDNYNSYFEDKVKNVYVLVATIISNLEFKILERGSLLAYRRTKVNSNYVNPDEPIITRSRSLNEGETKNDDTKPAEIKFDGAITLHTPAQGEQGNSVYAFIKDTPWEPGYGESEGLAVEEDCTIYLEGLDDIKTVDIPFRMYNKIGVTQVNHLYYYQKRNNSMPSNFVFRFYDSVAATTYWEVTFGNANLTGETADDSSDYPITLRNGTGYGVVYGHYQSLVSANSVDGESRKDNNQQRFVEVQGSYNLYNHPFVAKSGYNYPDADPATATSGTQSDRHPVSNTQFMVDQSIVTLNSPDIEFDTDVQRYATEDLKLRIIGAIPINAYASAHSIAIENNMLEVNHNVDSDTTTPKYGRGDTDIDVIHKVTESGAGRRMIAEFLWNDVIVERDNSKEDKIKTQEQLYDYMVYPWHKTGSLCNDWRPKGEAASWLNKKRISHILYSLQSLYNITAVNYNTVAGCQMCLTENDEVMNYRLPRQLEPNTGTNSDSYISSEINYYPNIDKVLYNDNGYKPIIKGMEAGASLDKQINPISMKYKSTSHAVIALPSSSRSIKLLPKLSGRTDDAYNGFITGGTAANPVYTSSGSTFWGDYVQFSQDTITSSVLNSYSYLWLGELYKTVTNKFGGDSASAIRNNKWLIGGPDVTIPSSGDVTLNWTEGDTYYQRYDCLKTYPFTEEDTNQMVEILSFMCETHVNIDGRYDRNRGQVDNTRMRPKNFNLLNPVYSQRNNFFTYRQLDHEGETSQSYPNHVAYSMSKNSTAERDEWTHVTLANILELDGDKGKLNKLTRFNDQLLAFQDTGISQILYNENTAISSTAGVPIEIANSGKVTGKRYLSDTIGCKNKWSMVNTPTGIYFMDDHDKSIYLFNGQLENLSTKFGFNSWCKKEMTGDVWRYIFTDDFKGYKGFRGCYDKQNQEVLFLNNDRALAFSEKIGAFTSFYDYYNDGSLCNLEGEGVWLKGTAVEHETEGDPTYTFETSLWGHQKGSYGRFFGENKPYWMTLVGNPEPQVDKMFTNLEFRACVDGEMVETESQQTEPSEFLLPFDELEVWNEYQHGYAELKYKNGHEAMIHHRTDNNEAALKRKFRIWRCDVPRDNAPITETDVDRGIYRTKVRPLDRIRNTWVYLKLMKKAAEDTVVDNVTTLVNLPRTEVHDMGLGYF